MTKSLGTLATFMWFFTSMNKNMSSKMPFFLENPCAVWTSNLANSNINRIILQFSKEIWLKHWKKIKRIYCCIFNDFSIEFLIWMVFQHVGIQIAFLIKSFATKSTRMWFFSCMNQDVSSHVIFFWRLFSTIWTAEFSIPKFNGSNLKSQK